MKNSLKMSNRLLRFLGVVLLLMAAALRHAQPTLAAGTVRVFAAASLKEALDQINANWQAQPGHAAVSASYAASPALAKQIELGAPADVFISADLDWMDYAAAKGLIKPETRKSLLGNTLVLIAPAGSGLKFDLKAGADLGAVLAGGKLAMGDVKSVPAGKYGKAALENLGLWSQVSASVAGSENVRAALTYVARGEAKLGIVYGSDAKAEPKVEVVATFPPDSHPPIVYPAALMASSNNPEAIAYLTFLSSPTARAIFIARGFAVLP